MSIEALIIGFTMILTSITSVQLDSKNIFQSVVLVDKALMKNQSSTWSSSLQEEKYYWIKNSIRILATKK